jgi:short-subunit dehydrogenase
MPYRLRNKVIWITGASSGIGEALTYLLAKKGNKLILSSRRKEELERVKGNCSPDAQTNIRILPLDLSEPSTLQLSVAAAIQVFGHIDVLVNNGGVSQRGLARETSIHVDRRIMEVDYFGTVALTKYLLPHFLSRKSGHIVVVSSVMGKIGTPYRSGYAAAKHALHGFFDSLRAELWKDSKRIYVTIICPGWVRTAISLHALTGTGEKLNAMEPRANRGIAPADFARKMVRAVEKKKREVYIGGMKELLGVYTKRFMPGLFARVIRKISVR